MCSTASRRKCIQLSLQEEAELLRRRKPNLREEVKCSRESQTFTRTPSRQEEEGSQDFETKLSFQGEVKSSKRS